ncbi:hypothetical protein HKX48_008002 [Thoreauomyces humboldtii]|nr:hypothetical protein HKX48_008002 [Thoreauomyces humboldtii]
MNQTEIEACIGNLGVQAVFEELAIPVVEAAATQGALAYGGPGVVVGTAWPLIALALGISTWRLKTKPNIRAVLLFTAVLFNVGDAINQSIAKGTSPFILLGDTRQARIYLNFLVILSQIRFGILFAAASWRFSAVSTSAKVRNALIYGMVAAAVVMTGVTVGVGLADIKKTKVVSKLYWGLVLILPIFYVILGLGVFTRSLRKAQREVKSSHVGMSHLQMSNNILMGLTIAISFVFVFVSQFLDADKNNYVIPTSLLLGTSWTLFENAFELLTIFQKAASVANSATDSRSKTGGGQQYSTNKMKSTNALSTTSGTTSSNHYV